MFLKVTVQSLLELAFNPSKSDSRIYVLNHYVFVSWYFQEIQFWRNGSLEKGNINNKVL